MSIFELSSSSVSWQQLSLVCARVAESGVELCLSLLRLGLLLGVASITLSVYVFIFHSFRDAS